MDNIAIERENVTKFLSALIDGNLSWKQHMNDVRKKISKISKSIGILYKSREIVKQPLLKQLYFSFIAVIRIMQILQGQALIKVT